MTSFEPKTPLSGLAAQLVRGETSSRALVESALERIEAAGGNGGAAFTMVDAAGARAQAQAADALRSAGIRLSPIAGLPLSVKDLFDMAGQPTRAASKVLANAPPATADAPTVARLRQAGAVLIGRTNMSEFAFSGIGLNPHYGSPASPWRRDEGRVPGGSSSGAAVSVAMGMAAAGLGTDTGGSLRIPAAFCGLTGFKPTAHRISTQGGVPLSTTLDSFGAIAPTVACCAMVDRILAGEAPVVPRPRTLKGMRLALLQNVVLDDLAPEVASAYTSALSRLSAAGVSLMQVTLPLLDDLPHINRIGFSSMEAWWYHRAFVSKQSHDYDPRVLSRIRRGEAASAADYLELLAARRACIAAAGAAFAGFDAVVLPTVPILPPRIEDMQNDEEAFFRVNGQLLRNPSIFNFLDGTALSLPLPTPGGEPVGLMVAGMGDTDDRVLGVGQSIEALLGR